MVRSSGSTSRTTPLLPLRTPSLAVVAQRHHLVASPDRHTCDVEGGSVEVAGGFGSDVAAHVEFGDVGAAAGEHDGVVAAHDCRPPVREQQRLGVVGVVADGDASVVEVGVQGVGGVAVAELTERFDLPLVLLATVVLAARAPGAVRSVQRTDRRRRSRGAVVGSPTRTAFAPVCCTSSRMRARSRVPAVPASSITSTVRASSPPGSLRSIAIRSRASVVDGISAAIDNSSAATPVCAAPTTR